MFRILAQEGGPLEVTFGSFESTWPWSVDISNDDPVVHRCLSYFM